MVCFPPVAETQIMTLFNRNVKGEKENKKPSVGERNSEEKKNQARFFAWELRNSHGS